MKNKNIKLLSENSESTNYLFYKPLKGEIRQENPTNFCPIITYCLFFMMYYKFSEKSQLHHWKVPESLKKDIKVIAQVTFISVIVFGSIQQMNAYEQPFLILSLLFILALLFSYLFHIIEVLYPTKWKE